MKQLIFMIAVTAFGVFGAFASTPFVGFAVYVFYAVLRPQFMWRWSLETYGQINWSLYVALATIAATVVFGPLSAICVQRADQTGRARSHDSVPRGRCARDRT